MELEITETRDVAVLDRILNDPAVLPHVSTDDSPKAPSLLSVAENPENTFYLVRQAKAVVGFFAFLAGEMHTCLLETCRGRSAVAAGKLAVAKFRAEHRDDILRTFAWAEEPRTTWFARAIGFVPVGSPHPAHYTRSGQRVTLVDFKFPCHS